MAIPDYEQAMVPVLRVLETQSPCHRREITERVADAFQLTAEERQQLLPSGKARVISSRVGWALAYMKQAGLVTSPKRAIYTIADRGRKTLAERPDGIDSKYLDRFPEFLSFRTRTASADDAEDTVPQVQSSKPAGARQTPEDALESAYAELRRTVEAELLQTVKAGSPAFFESLVIDLLEKMGYGGSGAGAARAVGRSGDGGIDGLIDEDRLGLDVIYIQAKRWEGTVGRPEIQKFAGALQGQRAKKGIFITTAKFSREAEEYVDRIDPRIVLIDGARLARLMFDHNVGVSERSTFKVKQLDGDYFEDA
jgi:restriction system protein